jgi:membrane protein
MWKPIRAKAKKGYTWLNTHTGGALNVLREAVERFGEAHASEAAASMAYYAIFSLFPLLLFLVAVGSSVLESQEAQQAIVDNITQILPTARRLIERNVQQVLELRGTVGVIGLIGLLWSATGVFTTLGHNINRAWSRAETRNFFRQRLVAISMVAGLLLLLALSLLSTTAVELLPRLQIPLAGGVSIYDSLLWTVASTLIPWIFTLLLFLSLYRWVPNTHVSWIAALWGAVPSTLGWHAITNGFAWYLNSGLARYELVYGSLGAVVALMFWIYLSSLITFFGAYVSAAVDRHRRRPTQE